jgi:hypothetical protein
MKNGLYVILLLINTTVFGQLPYSEIPAYPEKYSAGTVAARLIDGLGIRFYWATEGLNSSDVQFSPSEDSRSITETVDHIYDMSFLIANTVLPEGRKPETNKSFEEKRRAILQNLFDMRTILLKSSDKEFENYQANFSSGATFPFWNMLNGPIGDCLWHCGQIVMMRRMAGNPFNSNVSFFIGSLRN